MIPKLLAALRLLVAPLAAYWSAQTRRRKLILLANILIVFGAVLALSWYLRERSYKPLYTGLNDQEAGTAVERLRQMQVPFRLASNGGTILVPDGRLAELRLQLASEGLPQSGRLGFEIFDQANFGATEFAEQINFRRALEGELERSVLSLKQVERTRVHISLPKHSVFLDDEQPAKASVVLQLHPGTELNKQQLEGITNLVASAVEGLDAGKVVLIDTRGRLLARPQPGSDAGVSDEQLEYQRRLEQQVAAKIEATLEPYVGFDKTRVNAAADIDWSQGEQTRELLDPNTLVMTTQKLQENSGPTLQNGPPGTASNVPRQPQTAGSGLVVNSRVTETTNYQTSRTVTRKQLEKGAIRRLSVAVLVDSKTGYDASGQQVRNIRTDQEMLTLRELAVAAGGIDENRGDRLTIENLPFTIFEPIPPPAPKPVGPPWWSFILQIPPKYRYYVIGGTLGLLVLLAAGGWFLRRFRKRKTDSQHAIESQLKKEQKALDEAEAEVKRKESEQARLLTGLKTESIQSTKSQVLKKHLEQVAVQDAETFIQLLRSWIHEDEK